MNIRYSHKYYEALVKGCEANNEVCDSMKAEMSVCREMCGLLPLKMQKLMQEIQQ